VFEEAPGKLPPTVFISSGLSIPKENTFASEVVDYARLILVA
jgi:hypothetical protein